MSALEIFNFDESQVRVVMINGDPWFVATDVAKILGYATAKDLIRRLDEEDKGRHSVPTPGGDQVVSVISEPGMFAAIFGSQVEGAQAFKRWLSHDVLPKLRKTGTFALASMSPAEMLVAQAQLLVDADRRLALQEQRGEKHEARIEALEDNYSRVTGLGYAKLNGLPDSVDYLQKLGRIAGRIGRAEGLSVEKAHSTVFGTTNAWPVEIWDEALRQMGIGV